MGFWRRLNNWAAPCLSNSCGPCIGQWKRADGVKGKADSIVSSFNRNFPGRNDGISETLSFLASPEVVTAYAISGDLAFDPVNQKTQGRGWQGIQVSSRRRAKSFRPRDLPRARKALLRRRRTAMDLTVDIPPTSERLQLLQPFPRWDGKDFEKLPLLIKTKGKTTTDHISPAGSLAEVPRTSWTRSATICSWVPIARSRQSPARARTC